MTGLKPPGGFFVALRRLDQIVGDLASARSPRRRGVAFEPLLVAAQTSLDLVGGLFEAGIGLMRPALGMQADPRTQAQRAVRAIARTLSGEITTWPPTEPLK